METTAPLHETRTAAQPTKKQQSRRFGLPLLGNVGNLILLFFPWIHVQCRMDDQTAIEADVRGIDIALNQPAPELRDLAWNRGRQPTLGWHIVFLAVPALGALLSLVVICDAKPSKTIAALIALGACALLWIRGYFFFYEISVPVTKLCEELGTGILEVTWLPAFWAAVTADLFVWFSASMLPEDTAR